MSDLNARDERVNELILRGAEYRDARTRLGQRTIRGYRGGRHGGVATVTYARDQADRLQRRVDQESKDGNRKHTPVPRILRALVLLPIGTDFLIVFLYFSLVLNVDLNAPRNTPAELVTALVFAIIISLGLALALRWIGIRRRDDKNDQGVYDPPDGPRRWVPRLEMALLAILLAGIAAVMLVRVVTDARDAGVDVGTGWVVAVFLAVIIAALNWIIYQIEFADGSAQTHELDHWGKQLRPIEKKEDELTAKIQAADRQLSLARGDRPTTPPDDQASG